MDEIILGEGGSCPLEAVSCSPKLSSQKAGASQNRVLFLLSDYHNHIFCKFQKANHCNEHVAEDCRKMSGRK